MIKLHPRNKNRERYDLSALTLTYPELSKFIKPNKSGEDSIDFTNPTAVKALNRAILYHHYGIKYWDFPNENLCPPIPGRADYIHFIADLLSESNGENSYSGDQITCLDIGVGASCIYPIIGVTEYGWNFIGSDINPQSLSSAQKIIDQNPSLKNKIELRLQKKPRAIFKGILDKNEKINVSICNPPFHSSNEEAQKSNKRKVKNLTGKKVSAPQLNFSGISNELYYQGGEKKFIQNMIKESRIFSNNCSWFTTLVSKQSYLYNIYAQLEKIKVHEVKTIPMNTGNKSSRIVAWTFSG
jgi:23S rRNA (adenine1618-N6)-methyltransferase